MRTFVCILIAAFASTASYAQRIAELIVPVSKMPAGLDVPVSVNLDNITSLPDTGLSLVEVKNGKRVPVACQIENRGKRTLYWIVNRNGEKASQKVFELIKSAPANTWPLVGVSNDTGTLVISAGHKKLLQYNYRTHYPPAGVDTAFKRSGFIHPLWTPHGQSLTRINPPDHYHHYGLWNPWTKVLFEGRTVDFWNLKEKQGTVRFADLVSLNEGPVYGDYQTLHKHIAFNKENGTEKTAINELQSVRIYQPSSPQDYYIADITIQLNCATASPVVLEEYRYGGLGWRATADWNKTNSEMLTSEGKTRKDADGSKARWVIVQGSFGQDYGGAVMMSCPVNYNYPEPLRIWPESIGNGDVYANFSPTKDKDWRLEPGHDYVLRYRFLVFNGKYDPKKAETAWQYFAHPPEVVVKK